MLQVEHDPVVDAVYVRLAPSDSGGWTEELDEARIVDYRSDGDVAGVELLFVSHGVDLRDLPHADELAAALRRHGIHVLQPAGSLAPAP